MPRVRAKAGGTVSVTDLPAQLSSTVSCAGEVLHSELIDVRQRSHVGEVRGLTQSEIASTEHLGDHERREQCQRDEAIALMGVGVTA
jgi:hypothetical protein